MYTHYEILEYLLPEKFYKIKTNYAQNQNSVSSINKIYIEYKDNNFTMVSEPFVMTNENIYSKNNDDEKLRQQIDNLTPNEFMDIYEIFKKELKKLIDNVNTYQSLLKKESIKFDPHKIILIKDE